MKKRLFSVLVFCVLLVLACSACAEEVFTGTWYVCTVNVGQEEEIPFDGSLSYTFSADGSFEILSEGISINTGSWEAEGDTIHLLYRENESEQPAYYMSLLEDGRLKMELDTGTVLLLRREEAGSFPDYTGNSQAKNICAEDASSGTWYFKSIVTEEGELPFVGTMPLTFGPDGTFWFTVDGEFSAGGSWEAEGDTVHLRYEDNEYIQTADATVQEDGRLRFVQDDGTVLLFSREETESIHTEGKERADFVSGSDDWSGEFVFGPSTTSYHVYSPKLHKNDAEQPEETTGIKVTFLEGDEHLKDFVKSQSDYDNPGHMLLEFALPEVKAEGSAAFRIELESEHYYAEGIIHVTLISEERLTVELPCGDIYAPVGRIFSMNSLFNQDGREYVRTEPAVAYRCSVMNEDGEWNFDNDVMNLSYGSVTIRQSGDYPLVLTVSPGTMGEYKLTFPITVHASEETRTACIAQTAPISGVVHPRSEGFTLSKAVSGRDGGVQAFGSAFTGEETVNASIPLSGLLDPWLYVPSTLPANVWLQDFTSDVTLIPADKPEAQAKAPDSGEITFLSGDESLKDALLYDPEKQQLFVDNRKLTQPGEAVFRVRLKAGSLYYESEETLRVLSWEEEPLVEFFRADRSCCVKTQYRYYSPLLTYRLARDRFRDIAVKYGMPELADYDPFILSSESDLPVREHDWDLDTFWFGFKEPGLYPFSVRCILGNVQAVSGADIYALPYVITGTSQVRPGSTVRYAVQDAEDSSRQFALALEGAEGLSLAEDGQLTVADSVPMGTSFRITATPSDGSEPAFLEGTVSEGLFRLTPWKQQSLYNGFTVPMPEKAGLTKHEEDAKNRTIMNTLHGNDWMLLMAEAKVHVFNTYYEDPDTTADLLAEIARETQAAGSDLQSVDGHPVLVTEKVMEVSGQELSVGSLYMFRNNCLLEYSVYAVPDSGLAAADVQLVTTDDMLFLAEQIRYEAPEGTPRLADAAITLSSKDGAQVLPAGKKLQLTAVFANPETVNQKNKNNTVEWSVTDAATGETAKGVSVSEKGVVSVNKDLAEPKQVEVTASSPVFLTKAVYPLTVLPAVSKIAVEPKEVFFYAGTDAQETLRAVLAPETVPAVGLTWTLKKEGVVELTDNGDGTATVKPLDAGKFTVTLTEPGGKTATATVNVTEAVETVELSLKDKPFPGASVGISASVLPKSAGNRAVSWSLDVGEDIATISEKGQLKIGKETPAGTVIRVTCTAEGAPEPVLAVLEVVVAEK